MIAEAGQRLEEAGISNGRQEARWIISGILSQQPLCHGGCEVPEEAARIFDSQVGRRLQGEPLQYVMGNAAFHCIELLVAPACSFRAPKPSSSSTWSSVSPESLISLALSHQNVYYQSAQ